MLVPPGDQRALADAVVDVLADEPRRRGAARRARARDRALRVGRIARRLLEIYEETVARGVSASSPLACAAAW